MVEPPRRPPGSDLSRRGFGRGVIGATISSGLFTGCRPCFLPEPPRKREPARKRGPRTYTVRVPVEPTRFRRLRDLLDDPSFNPFETNARGIHYARLFIASHRWLYFMVVYDDYWSSIDFLGHNAVGVDEVFCNCQGYPDQGAADAEALDAFLRKNMQCVQLFYRAYDHYQPQIRNALVLRDHFLGFLRGADGGSQQELRRRYAELVADPYLLAAEDDDEGAEETDVRLEPCAPDRVNPFTFLAPLHPDKVKRLERRLAAGTFLTIDLGTRPLEDLPTLHFARVSVVDHEHMLFASVYDGDFVQYVEDFSARISDEIDEIFGACVGYPRGGAADVYTFKAFLQDRQIPTNAFGGAYLDRSVLQIKSSLALVEPLNRFTRAVRPEHPRLRRKLDRFLYDNQALLG